MKPFIEAKGLTTNFGDLVALEDISFVINKGDIVACVGPNGSGKSTLAKILIGLDIPTSGTVMIDGKPSMSAKHRIGYMPQWFDIDRSTPVTVEEFLCLVKSHTKKYTPTAVLKRVGLAGTEEKQLGTLSGGQMQRLFVARALLLGRDILLLDEPTSGIDVGGEEALYELLHTLNHEEGTTIIVISHELDFVYEYATNVICLNRKLLCSGAPREVLTSEIMEKMYGGHVKHYAHGCEHKH